MDFDHIDRSEKSFDVSKTEKYSVRRAQEEIAKCDLVCANCHRLRSLYIE